MSELKRTQLYDTHVGLGATMVNFGGWEMPVQYPEGILAEHLYTRRFCSLFDVSHMGRLVVEGPDRLAFLQHVLTSNAKALDVMQAQYCIIPDAEGYAVDDAYLNRFEEDRYLLVVNAANKEKDIAYLNTFLGAYDCTLTDVSAQCAAIAVQGPKSEELLSTLAGGAQVTLPKRNALNTLNIQGRTVYVSRTGYTGEPIGYEVYLKSEDAAWLWNLLLDLGAKPAGLGARDTLRLEGGLPLYGHELGMDPYGGDIPIFAVSLARFAVNFSEEKGDFVGREPLLLQREAYQKLRDGDFSGMKVLRKRIMQIALLERGVMRAGMAVFRGEEPIGLITSGTMVPYYLTKGEGSDTVLTNKTARRSIGFCYINSDVRIGDIVQVQVRTKRLRAVIPGTLLKSNTPPYALPVIYRAPQE